MSRKLTKLPGFCDVHVHLREPGFSYKETIYAGSRACAKGGYTDVCTMPNLNPISDTPTNINMQHEIIRSDSVINIWPYAAISLSQAGKDLVDMEKLAPLCIAFSDDGHGVQDDNLMEEAMLRAKSLNKMIVAHCEVNDLLNGGYIHDGKYCAEHGHIGISSASEYKMIERDLVLAAKTGCKYHVCHISTKESVELIKEAKSDGVNVTCETAPHYLILCDEDIHEDGKWKMNPPLRGRDDRDALIDGVLNGTIDMIATDHAPHSEEEKSRGLKDSAFGITGIELAFPLLYTYLVREGVVSIDKIIQLLTENPRNRFCITKQDINSTYSEWDLDEKFIIEPDNFISKGHSTPFEGRELYGVNYKTVLDGKVIWRNE